MNYPRPRHRYRILVKTLPLGPLPLVNVISENNIKQNLPYPGYGYDYIYPYVEPKEQIPEPKTQSNPKPNYYPYPGYPYPGYPYPGYPGPYGFYPYVEPKDLKDPTLPKPQSNSESNLKPDCYGYPYFGGGPHGYGYPYGPNFYPYTQPEKEKKEKKTNSLGKKPNCRYYSSSSSSSSSSSGRRYRHYAEMPKNEVLENENEVLENENEVLENEKKEKESEKPLEYIKPPPPDPKSFAKPLANMIQKFKTVENI